MGNVLMITVRDHELLIAEIRTGFRKTVECRTVRRQLPEGCASGGRIADSSGAAAVLRETLKMEGIRSGKVLFIIPACQTIIRNISLPGMDDKSTMAAVRINSDLYFPFDITAYAVSFYRTEEKIHAKQRWPASVLRKTQEKESLMAAAVRNDVLQPYFDMMSQTHLTVVGAECAQHLIFRMMSRVCRSECVMAVYPDGDDTVVSIIDNGCLKVQRCVAASRLGTELRSTAKYYDRRYPEKPLEKIVLTGSFKDPELCRLKTVAEGQFDIPVEIREVPIVAENIGYRFPCPDRGFFPKKEAHRRAQRKRKAEGLLIFGIGIVIAAMLLIPPACFYFDVKTKHRELKHSLETAGNMSAELSLYHAAAMKQEDLLTVREYTAGTQEKLLMIAELPERAAVPGITVRSFSAAEGRVTMAVRADNMRNAAKFIHRVKEAEGVYELRAGSVNDSGNETDFEITFLTDAVQKSDQTGYGTENADMHGGMRDDSME